MLKILIMSKIQMMKEDNYGRSITDRKDKIQEKSDRINQSEMSKTMFEARTNYISKYIDNHLLSNLMKKNAT